MDELTPRDNAPKRETLSDDQKAIMADIEHLTQDQAAAMAVLAQAQAQTAAACADMADTLDGILAILVKVSQQFAVPLPTGIISAIAEKSYDPDAVMGDDEEEGDEDDEGDEFTDAKK